ncbi:MAG: nitrous oxide-stimulated promoter family protein [Selenomonas sp.]|uniref:nitrous oxide-stimulated promoter family protein n=1 Tax=Selenomonas sp. TaxID=2053611 RepID=UPI0025D682D1|nr:nitrous oxide-stimulated promoter family protein [Selenomonas sp.]MCR5756628.1 nitrous oxide-stimulated promoter family protein [Selenomonas sp.]
MAIDVEKKRREEVQTVREIIKIYCRGHKHKRNPGDTLCRDCQFMADYALQRLEKCPRMDIKTFCSVCPIHCYGQQEAAKIKEIMRYGGPRMLFVHPLMALRHILIEWRTRHGLRKKEAVVRR